MAVGARPNEQYATSPRSTTSLARMASAVHQNVDDPAQDLDRFIRVVATNVAIGNCSGTAETSDCCIPTKEPHNLPRHRCHFRIPLPRTRQESRLDDQWTTDAPRNSEYGPPSR